MIHVSIVTLFGSFFDHALSISVLGRAADAGVFTWSVHDPREHAEDRHRTVDDTPYGGGAGMVLRAPELAAATKQARTRAGSGPVILLTPQGERLTQGHVAALAELDAFTLVCGRYEGPDERFIERHVDVELSLGDFILSGGEPASLALIDAVVRLQDGALGNRESTVEESHSAGALEYPHFTRPLEFEDLEVPAVLRSGDHARIARWRSHLSALRTRARRPDLGCDKPALIKKDKRDPEFKPQDWLLRPRTLADYISRTAPTTDEPTKGTGSSAE